MYCREKMWQKSFLATSKTTDCFTSKFVLDDSSTSSRPTIHQLDSISPVFTADIEELRNCEKFIGLSSDGSCIVYVRNEQRYRPRDSNEPDVTHLISLKYCKLENCMKRHCSKTIPNSNQAHAYGTKILSSDRTFCLLVTKKENNIYISWGRNKNEFEQYHIFHNQLTIKLSDEYMSKSFYCLSADNSMLACVQGIGGRDSESSFSSTRSCFRYHRCIFLHRR